MNSEEAKELYNLIKEEKYRNNTWSNSYIAGYVRCLTDIADITKQYWNIERLKKWSERRKQSDRNG